MCSSSSGRNVNKSTTVRLGDTVTVLLVDGLQGLPVQQHYRVHPGDPNYRHMVGRRAGSATWAVIEGKFFGGRIASIDENNYPTLPTALPAPPERKPRPKPEPETVRFFGIPTDPVLAVAATAAARPHRSHPAVRSRLG